jgi:hypothetical protein
MWSNLLLQQLFRQLLTVKMVQQDRMQGQQQQQQQQLQ